MSNPESKKAVSQVLGLWASFNSVDTHNVMCPRWVLYTEAEHNEYLRNHPDEPTGPHGGLDSLLPFVPSNATLAQLDRFIAWVDNRAERAGGAGGPWNEHNAGWTVTVLNRHGAGLGAEI